MTNCIELADIPEIVAEMDSDPQSESTPNDSAYGGSNAQPTLEAHVRRKIFGVGKGRYNDHVGVNLEDFEAKYPPDPYCQEMGADARVWRVYIDEAGPFSAAMIESFMDNLDLLMIFAGLFSAVVATTATVSAQALQSNPAQVSADLLDELISVVRASANGTPVNDVPRSSVTSTTPFIPSNSAQWINRLWFTSLALSLAAALMAVLARQWLLYYISLVSGTARDRVRMHRFRHQNFLRWKVPVIIGLLPVLIHLSLMAYFVGLVLFLVPLDFPTAVAVAVISCAACSIYILANILPLIFPHCPYKSPVSTSAFVLIRYILKGIRKTKQLLSDIVSQPSHKKTGPFSDLANSETLDREVRSLRQLEAKFVRKLGETLDISALLWLANVSTNPSVFSVVLQSLSGLSIDFNITAPQRRKLQTVTTEALLSLSNEEVRRRQKESSTEVLVEIDAKLERLSRSLIHISKAHLATFSSLELAQNVDKKLRPATLFKPLDLHIDQCPAAEFLVRHRHGLHLHPTIWRHLLQQAMDTFLHGSSSLRAQTAERCWPLALEFLRRDNIIIMAASRVPLTRSDRAQFYERELCYRNVDQPEELLCTRCEAVRQFTLLFLHRVYCSQGDPAPNQGHTCPYLFMPGYHENSGVHLSHLMFSLWFYGRRKRPSAVGNLAWLLQYLRNFVNFKFAKTAERTGSVTHPKHLSNYDRVAFDEMRDNLEAIVSAQHLYGENSVLIGRDVFLIFKWIIDQENIRSEYIFHQHTIDFFLSSLHRLPPDHDHNGEPETGSSTSSIIHSTLSNAFARSSISAFSSFQKADGLRHFRDLLDVEDVLTDPMSPTTTKRLEQIAATTRVYVKALFSDTRAGYEERITYFVRTSYPEFYTELQTRYYISCPQGDAHIFLPSFDLPLLPYWLELLEKLLNKKEEMTIDLSLVADEVARLNEVLNNLLNLEGYSA